MKKQNKTNHCPPKNYAANHKTIWGGYSRFSYRICKQQRKLVFIKPQLHPHHFDRNTVCTVSLNLYKSPAIKYYSHTIDDEPRTEVQKYSNFPK